ncbi:unnamed protein product [Rotaria sordida]|uniref:F-box domain-containing protein n=2 Tax=Rotaria sordida TaxID=392033 RepID=A0A819IYR8_9BILA|nr:unnamed protein product [Rotaria sordida]
MDINPIKRQFSFNHSIDVKTKKLRKTSDEENLSITCFEHLSNDLFYEIFDYLDAYDIYKAFSKLNIRFYNLLTFSSLPLKINLSKQSESILEHCCRNVIIPNKHRILSLHLNGDSLINKFFTYCNIDSSFNRLQSIILSGLSDYKLLMILFYLNTIEHLVLNHHCNIDELTSILTHTPHLRYLTCRHPVEIDEIARKEILLTLPNLTYICFVRCALKFDILEKFMRKISSQLQVWHLNTYEDAAYLDANRWKRLIKIHIPHLRKFYFNHHMSIDDGDIVPNCESINQFTSIFWIERQWFFELKDELHQFVYSIYPYRKRWYDNDEYEQFDINLDVNTHQQKSTYIDISRQQETTNSFIQSIPCIQLIITDNVFAVWYPSYTDHFTQCNEMITENIRVFQFTSYSSFAAPTSSCPNCVFSQPSMISQPSTIFSPFSYPQAFYYPRLY